MGWKTLIAGAVMALFAATAVQAAPSSAKPAPAAKPAAAAKPAVAASAQPAAPKAVHHHRHHRKHHRRHGMKTEAAVSAGAYASPKQPVAYALLDAYMKASPKERASRDWSGGPAPMMTSQAPMAPAPTAAQDAPPPATASPATP